MMVMGDMAYWNKTRIFREIYPLIIHYLYSARVFNIKKNVYKFLLLTFQSILHKYILLLAKISVFCFFIFFYVFHVSIIHAAAMNTLYIRTNAIYFVLCNAYNLLCISKYLWNARKLISVIDTATGGYAYIGLCSVCKG